jgi:hypothetical protein
MDATGATSSAEAREDRMAARDGGGEFLAAFGIGAALGLGAALLLGPAPDPRRRLAKRAKPHGKRAGRQAKRARRAAASAEAGAGVRAGITHEAIAAGREILAEFRAEVDRIVERARGEIAEARAHLPRADAPGEDARG